MSTIGNTGDNLQKYLIIIIHKVVILDSYI